jgi:hypothetical protein
MRKITFPEVEECEVCVSRVAVVALAVIMVGQAPLVAQAPVATETKTVRQHAGQEDPINADRPGIADGSTVIGGGRFQVETGFQQEFRREGGITERTRFLPTLLRLGLSSRWEARVETNTFTQTETTVQDGGPNPISGLAPVSIGVKYHIQDSAGLRQPSLGTILRVFPASGTNTFHTDQATGDLRFAADWDLTPRLSLNPNVGLGFFEGDKDGRFVAGLFALTLNYFNTGKTINPFVDVGLQAPEESAAGSSFIFDGGIAYLPSRNMQIDVSAGAGPHRRIAPNRFFSIGFSVRFRAS